MLKEFQGKVFLAVGRTYLRRGIDGLAAIVQEQFDLDPFTETLFLFCGRRKDRIKGRVPVSCSCTSGWKAAPSSGLKAAKKRFK